MTVIDNSDSVKANSNINNNNNNNNKKTSENLSSINNELHLSINDFNTEDKSNLEIIELEKDKKYLNENYCYLWTIAKMDKKIKEMHRRWSKID